MAAAAPAYAQAEDVDFNIPAQSLSAALDTFAAQSRQPILVTPDMTANKVSRGVEGTVDTAEALNRLLEGTGLTYRIAGKTFLIVQGGSGGPQSSGAGGDVEALIVTAQKREENIQDVPIAISAFSQEDLTRSQVAGGPDLITQVPNMTFTKTNFSSYSVQIRGIGTQAISATTDPAVAIAFNNTPFIRNRFFEQEFYDLQRVEVLRGPQGTLYGRNATAGVVNIISAKPKFVYEAKASADVGNFKSTRVEAMVNIPLVEDAVALRLAGAWTKRDGYVTNLITGNPTDGRDLWSTRLSLRFTPNDAIDANLIWEHFEENDGRLRSAKQLCKKDVVTELAGFPVSYFQTLPEYGQQAVFSGVQASFSQGCERESLYSPDSFQTPNGLSLPYYVPLGAIFLPTALNDPYVTNQFSGTSQTQQRDLRAIESTIDPDYRAKSDLGEFQISIDLGGGLTLASETAYAVDEVFSLEDFNRFNTAPGAWRNTSEREGVMTPGPNGGIFCDPQLGCSDRLVAVDISTATASQFSQEFRLSSDWDGPFNFSLGANFLRADSEDKYYVFINSLSIISAISPYGTGDLQPYVGGVTDNASCLPQGLQYGDPAGVYPVANCTYIDPNPIGALNDQGHNYFLSKNPYKLISYAAFGETYYQITDNLKITGGLRLTVDKKEAPRIPSWTLAAESYGYPVAEVIEQEWREPTGRLAIDWKPDLPFTDETLLYASYAHGYKAGGANPPRFTYIFYASGDVAEAAAQASETRPKTFDPEFIDAFELGSKNTFADGTVTLNLAAFYYDYKDYQISEIVDRSAFNRNFDATVWGAEVEADWRPIENLRLGLKGGYEDTRIADGERAIDLMDRTAGDPNWVIHRPFPTFASSCVFPTWLFVGNVVGNPGNPEPVNVGGVGGGNPGGCELAYLQGFDPATAEPFTLNPTTRSFLRTAVDYPSWSTDLADYPCWPTDPGTGQPVPLSVRNYPGVDAECLAALSNNGEGFTKDLSGNELPNAPHWTWTITGDYTVPLANDWLATLHTDLHWQSESWWRVFNDSEFGKLDEYFTMNVAAIFTNEEAGWNVMAYVKNVTDETAITGAFLNSDDTGLTTNVFLTEPRLYGIRITKNFTGGPLLGSFGERHDGPYAFTVEIGGQAQRHDAPYEPIRPGIAGAFPSNLDVFDAPQGNDLDWGDGRDVKLTWRPDGGPWTASAAVRFGRTNGTGPETSASQNTDEVCAFGGYLAFYCPPPGDEYHDIFYFYGTDWANAQANGREDHRLVDFAVGRDVGVGGLTSSSLSAGLRYADFTSTTHVEARGIPDWFLPEGVKYPNTDPVTHSYREAVMDAQREFEGAGPLISWAASQRLFGGDEAGGIDLDWSVGAGALFGKQTTTISSKEKSSFYARTPYFSSPTVLPLPYLVTPVSTTVTRSNEVTVPVLDLSLGLTYSIDRISIGAGYRWERYFDAIDGGFAAEQSYDRTIDGPYFKIAVGFGG